MFVWHSRRFLFYDLCFMIYVSLFLPILSLMFYIMLTKPYPNSTPLLWVMDINFRFTISNFQCKKEGTMIVETCFVASATHGARGIYSQFVFNQISIERPHDPTKANLQIYVWIRLVW